VLTLFSWGGGLFLHLFLTCIPKVCNTSICQAKLPWMLYPVTLALALEGCMFQNNKTLKGKNYRGIGKTCLRMQNLTNSIPKC